MLIQCLIHQCRAEKNIHNLEVISQDIVLYHRNKTPLQLGQFSAKSTAHIPKEIKQRKTVILNKIFNNVRVFFQDIPSEAIEFLVYRSDLNTSAKALDWHQDYWDSETHLNPRYLVFCVLSHEPGLLSHSNIIIGKTSFNFKSIFNADYSKRFNINVMDQIIDPTPICFLTDKTGAGYFIDQDLPGYIILLHCRKKRETKNERLSLIIRCHLRDENNYSFDEKLKRHVIDEQHQSAFDYFQDYPKFFMIIKIQQTLIKSQTNQ